MHIKSLMGNQYFLRRKWEIDQEIYNAEILKCQIQCSMSRESVLILGQVSCSADSCVLVQVMKITFTPRLQRGNELHGRWTRWRSFALSEHWKLLLWAGFLCGSDRTLYFMSYRGTVKGLIYDTVPSWSNIWQWVCSQRHYWCWISLLLRQFSPCAPPHPQPGWFA